MAATYQGLMSLKLPEREFTYTERDAMLYAVATGFGADPMDDAELPFFFELNKERKLRTSPGLSTVVAWDDSWGPRSGLNMVMVVHGEQRIEQHRTMPVAATVVSRTRIADAIDKGPGKGALVIIETELTDKASGEKLCTHRSTVFARGDGGIGAPAGGPTPSPKPHQLPDRKPDAVVEAKTSANQALYYRLCGDRNPLHAEPAFAKAGGFPRPILHGLCTYGHACRAVLKAACNYDPAMIASIEARFTAPVFPGEQLVTEIWIDGKTVSFRVTVPERNVVALSNGKAVLR